MVRGICVSNFRAISRKLIKLWQIYEFTVLRSSGTAGTAIPKLGQKCLKYVKKFHLDILNREYYISL
jgi:hypothetical protein